MDFKSNDQDVIKVQTSSFNSRSLAKVLYCLLRNMRSNQRESKSLGGGGHFFKGKKAQMKLQNRIKNERDVTVIKGKR